MFINTTSSDTEIYIKKLIHNLKNKIRNGAAGWSTIKHALLLSATLRHKKKGIKRTPQKIGLVNIRTSTRMFIHGYSVTLEVDLSVYHSVIQGRCSSVAALLQLLYKRCSSVAALLQLCCSSGRRGSDEPEVDLSVYHSSLYYLLLYSYLSVRMSSHDSAIV